MCDNLIDPGTGVKLTPSYHGSECLGSGDHPGVECCCDECDHYLTCFPDWEEQIDAAAARILEEFRPALEELAK